VTWRGLAGTKERMENAADYTSMINSAREPGPMLIEVCL
jgi:hypothetical protein